MAGVRKCLPTDVAFVQLFGATSTSVLSQLSFAIERFITLIALMTGLINTLFAKNKVASCQASLSDLRVASDFDAYSQC